MRKYQLIALAFLAVVLAGLRLHTFGEPLERDITTYAVIGNGLLEGRQLYVDLWDHKPPGVHWTYAMTIAAVGFGPTAVLVLAVLTGIIVLCGVVATASAPDGRITGAVTAGVMWVLLSGDLWLEGNQPNTEAFINSCLVWAFVLLLRADRSKKPRAAYLATGTLFALSSIYKHSTVLVAAVITGAHLLGRQIGRTRTTAAVDAPPRSAIIDSGRRFGWIVAPGIIAWVGVGGYFALTGGFGDFFDAVFTYNRFYAAGAPANLSSLLGMYQRIPTAALPGILAVTTVVAIGCLVDGFRNPREWLLLGSYLLSTCLVIVLPGRFYPHYFLLLLPPLVVGYGWTLDALSYRIRRPWRGLTAAALGTVSLAIVLWQEIPTYSLPAEEWSRQKYGDIFIDSARLGRVLDRTLPADTTFYEIGAETGLYFYSRRDPPSGVLYDYPLLTDTPLRHPLTQRVLADLERTRPAVVVVRRGRRTPEPIDRWIRSNYTEAPSLPSVPRFEILARRGWPPPGADGPESTVLRSTPSLEPRRLSAEALSERTSALAKGPR